MTTEKRLVLGEVTFSKFQAHPERLHALLDLVRLMAGCTLRIHM